MENLVRVKDNMTSPKSDVFFLASLNDTGQPEQSQGFLLGSRGSLLGATEFPGLPFRIP